MPHKFHGAKYTHQRSRKVMRLWAEKEFDVLGRLHRVGVPCPRPLYVNGKVLW